MPGQDLWSGDWWRVERPSTEGTCLGEELFHRLGRYPEVTDMMNDPEIRRLWIGIINRIHAVEIGGGSVPILDPAALMEVRLMLEMAQAESADGELPRPVLYAARRLETWRSHILWTNAGPAKPPYLEDN